MLNGPKVRSGGEGKRRCYGSASFQTRTDCCGRRLFSAWQGAMLFFMPAISAGRMCWTRCGGLRPFTRCDSEIARWDGALPESLRITLGGTVFFVIHRRADISPAADAAAIVVFGHSHQYSEKIENGRLWLNPGSCGPRRFGREASMALLWIEDNQYRSQKIVIQPETRK